MAHNAPADPEAGIVGNQSTDFSSRGENRMDYRSIVTTCPYCACGCGLVLEVLDGRIVCTLPSKTSPTNQGKLCIKGWNVHEFV